MFNNHKQFVFYVILGYFICPYSSQYTPIDECSNWNASEKEIIFGDFNEINVTDDFNETNATDDFALNLLNSALDINRETEEIAILDDRNHRVLIFDRSNTSVLTMIVSSSSNATNSSSILYSPSAITYDQNNSLYVLDLYQTERQIVRLDSTLEYGVNATTNFMLNSTSSPFVNHTMRGLAIDYQNGSIFISDSTSNRIIYYNESTRNYSSLYFNNGISPLSSPRSIVMDSNRNLYVNDFGNNRILRLQLDTQISVTLSIKISNCLGLSLYPSDVLLLNTNTTVYLFNLTTKSTRCIFGCDDSSNEFTNIHNAIIDNNGSLIITNDNEILSFPLYQQCPQETTQSTTITTAEITKSTSTTTPAPVRHGFMPNQNCSEGRFGINCSSSNNICNVSQPCYNSGICNSTNTNELGYICDCQWGFNGTRCENDIRPCQFFTCFQRGECTNTSLTEYNCTCRDGYTGLRCEIVINFCANVTCQNRAVCTQKNANFTCNCLAGYSGRYCEIEARSSVVRGYVTKSFSYIAILMLLLIIGFIVIMDVLKYGFGIDPVEADRKALRQRQYYNKQKKKNMQKQEQQPRIAYRFRYVN